jgi:hypothetical protein
MGKHSDLRKFLTEEHESGGLCVIAARAKVPEGELHDIVVNGKEISESLALMLSGVVEPKDDQWQVDDDECDPLAVAELTDDEIRERLQLAADNGKLNMVALTSGVKGGEATLQGILQVGEGSIDPLTRSLLIAIME